MTPALSLYRWRLTELKVRVSIIYHLPKATDVRAKTGSPGSHQVLYILGVSYRLIIESIYLHDVRHGIHSTWRKTNENAYDGVVE